MLIEGRARLSAEMSVQQKFRMEKISYRCSIWKAVGQELDSANSCHLREGNRTNPNGAKI